MSDPANETEDLTGRSRFAQNVAFAWGGYLVNVVAGFIMPRLISDRLGQTTLGIWDFSWSVVSYFGLVQLGLSASVSRYVARHRAKGDTQALARSVSTIGLFLKGAAVLAAVLTLVTAEWILPLFQEKLSDQLATSRWVVLVLGGEIVVSLLFTVYTDVIVGCHRWDVHNLVSVAVYAVMTAGMVVVLLSGGGLVGLALTHCLATAGGDLARWRIAQRVCPELKINYRLASWPVWLEQARFSVKNLLPRLAALFSNQAVSILLVSFLGPAVLAIYSRPRSLTNQLQTLAAKFGSILVPTASSLQARGESQSLQATFLETTRAISCLTLPVMVLMALFGDFAIQLWMGSAYVQKGLMAILICGAFPTWVQEPVWSILAGMNQHGRVALARLAGAVVSAAGAWLILALWPGNLLWVVAGVVVPQMVVDGIVTPLMACRRLDVPARTYLVETLWQPLLYVAPFAACLGLARLAFPAHLWLAAGCASLGMMSLATVYWCRVLPEKWKRHVFQRLRPGLRSGSSVAS